jgi:hypothetical protein
MFTLLELPEPDQIAHAVDVRFESREAGIYYFFQLARYKNVVEASDNRSDGFLEDHRALRVDVDAVGVLRPVDGFQQAFKLLNVLVGEYHER